MTNNTYLTHDLAMSLQTERNAVSTGAAFATKSESVVATVRRAFGARLISLGARLSGENVAVPAGIS